VQQSTQQRLQRVVDHLQEVLLAVHQVGQIQAHQGGMENGKNNKKCDY
jgi:hypothetical protein